MADNTQIRVGMTGEEVLLSLIYPRTKNDMTESQLTEFAAAVAIQESFMASATDDEAILSKKVGDVSVTYAADLSTRCSGVKISPSAKERLMRCGLMLRWV